VPDIQSLAELHERLERAHEAAQEAIAQSRSLRLNCASFVSMSVAAGKRSETARQAPVTSQ